MGKIRFGHILAWVGLAAALWTGLAAPSVAAAQGKPAPASVTVGMLPPFPFYWATYTAIDGGFFKEQGLNVEMIQFSRPSEAVQALVGGSVHIAQVSADAFINAIDAGARISIIGQAVGNPVFSVVVQPEHRTWADLKGKSVAVSAPKDGAAIFFRLMAQANGLRDGDYTFISVGITPNRYAALKNRAADAAVLGQPHDFIAVEEGYRLLARSDSVLKRSAFIMVGANTAWAQAHRDEVVRYLTALARTVDWLYAPANKTAAIDILMKAMRRAKREALEKIYALYFEEAGGTVIPSGARVDLEGLRVYGQALKDLEILKGPVDPARWTDLSYQQAVPR